MCAIEAGKHGRRVAVLEHSDRLGKKILISGGGRCNFTNLHCSPESFLSSNPHFAKSALSRYTPADFIALVEKHGIPYHEKTLGQLFCDRSARDIVNMLTRECADTAVEIHLNVDITGVRRETDFIAGTTNGEFRSQSLVVATGGLSIPKIGATPFGYELARQFGLAIVPPRAALVPLVMNPDDRRNYCELAGVSAEVIASLDHQQFREKMLITHRGLSGPAILQISSYWSPGQMLTIDLAPDRDIVAPLLSSPVRRDLNAARAELRKVFSTRFADRWLDLHQPARWTNHDLSELERQTHSWRVPPQRPGGFEKAEVTSGGIDTDELSARTMESKKVPGLYFVGEIVDVTGHLGGFNFQWAWASGWAAGQDC